ncbi:TPA: restriction endonuclease subunit S [Streptococcus suis]
MKTNNNIPVYRFQGYTDAWELRKLGKLTSYRNGKGYEDNQSDFGKYELINLNSISIEGGLKPSGKFINSASETLNKNDLVMVLSDVGHGDLLGRVAIIPEDDRFVLNQRVALLRNNDYADYKYLFAYINANQHYFKLQGAGSSQLNLSKKAVENFVVHIPSQKEQSTIGTFFSTLDRHITLHQRKFDTLKEQKKTYLKLLFPAKGQTKPALRFQGIEDDWEEVKLGKILKERNEQIAENEEYPLMSFVQGVGVTPKGERYDRSFLVKEDNKKYKKTELGDFIYSSNNLETGSIGFNKTGKAVISPVYSIFYSKDEFESSFIGILSQRKDFIAKMIKFRQGVVYGQWRIHENDFLQILLRIPTKAEMEKIIIFFQTLDQEIAQVEDKLASLKEMKKTLLRKLFV